MPFFINQITGLPYPPETPLELFVIPAWQQSLMSSILSVGTFSGAIIAGELATNRSRTLADLQVILLTTSDGESQSLADVPFSAWELLSRLLLLVWASWSQVV